MPPITLKLLLERGSPKSTQLEKIKSLNLSDLSLENTDLDSTLLRRLTSLEELDVSGNLLTELPARLPLPALRRLNCTNNQLEEVTSLKQFRMLEELSIEDNLYMTISDSYKLMFLLPKLRRLNGKEITSTANHVRFVASEELSKRVSGLWERNFQEQLPSSPSAAQARVLGKEFVKVAETQVKYGASSLSDYTKWRVRMIARDLLSSRLGVHCEASSEEEDLSESESGSDVREEAGSEQNRVPAAKRKEISSESSPRKRTCLSVADDITQSAEHSPRRSARFENVSTANDKAGLSPGVKLRESPRKSVQSLRSPRKLDQTQQSPRKAVQSQPSPSKSIMSLRSPRKAEQPEQILRKPVVIKESPRKVDLPKTVMSQPDISMDTPRKSQRRRQEKETARKGQGEEGEKEQGSRTPCRKSKDPITLKPLHFLQCHSKQNSPDDFSTQLWACAFEPQIDSGGGSNGRSSRTVATCGGESVCVIDCETGSVLNKYKVSGEQFFSLAWSTTTLLTGDGRGHRVSVLAAAGSRGVVKLIHPKASLAYGEFRASRRAVSTLRFSPAQESFLFTGTYDRKIILWDIGGLDCEYNFKVSQLLFLEAASIPLHLRLVPSSPEQRLLAACEGGLLLFDIQLSKNQLKRSSELEFHFPIYKKEEEENEFHLVDSLSFLNNDIVVSKSAMQGSIYLWSWSKTLASRKKSREVEVEILAELQWSSTELPYISLSTCPGEDYVVCGDEKGDLWTYEVSQCLRARAKTDKMIPPTQILRWPAPNRKGHGLIAGTSVNSIAMDPELQYLVALTDKNIAAVWKRA
ncbi:leucine-rich repeat and WD repeat-containing protein 1 [Polyodon spathula]|uniref:leucine-rich repeat and WD repeat-containing protein 1 n=1 Tax=Polyodon spathula TaxID=7913 RepID=UPI001B7E6B8F|nr:leucine-rich repeat and WD repeat-containing protein 1 [Polyodon spathula]XP_041096816.1 leucine-rich repeat and WD repeat-containing protein 1 [Polyodon spathula]